ncbi:MAG: Hsp70 family protein, partial [Planctomycetota bacterium]
MAITAEPIHIEEITRGSGVRQRLTRLTNQSEDPITVKVEDFVQLPEWVELEELTWGSELKFGPHESRDVVVIINTNHQYFADTDSVDDDKVGPDRTVSHNSQVRIKYESGEETVIPIFLPRIILEMPAFQGIFGIDFGTSNSCYAWRKPLKQHGAAGSGNVAEVSAEIPSVIFFKDVTGSPHYVIGTDARREMKRHSEKTYAYFLSVKRLLGVNKRRPFMVIDASPNVHHQLFDEVQLAAFLIRGILQMAQDELGERVLRVYATFPTLFSRPRKQALEESLRKALELLSNDQSAIPRDAVTLEVDEACAAAFGSIYEQIHEQFAFGDVQGFEKTLIAYDAGGGTTDIALMDVSVTREKSGRVLINQKVRGLSGDSFWGGDNVTLEVFRLLKVKIAMALARHKLAGKQEAEKKDEAADDDIWGAPPPDPVQDVWASGGKKPADEAAEEEDKKEVFYADDEFVRACELVQEWGAALKLSQSHRIKLAAAVKKLVEDQGKGLDNSEIIDLAKRLEEAVDMLVPTRWTWFADHNQPKRERKARQVFYELWSEADAMKIRAVIEKEHKATVLESLDTLADYADVPPEVFSEINIDLREIEDAIEPQVRDTIQKAHGLLERATEKDRDKKAMAAAEAAAASGMSGADTGILRMPSSLSNLSGMGGGGLVIGGAPAAPGGGAIGTTKPVRVLLAGNSSKLPLIRRIFCEVFQKPENELFADSTTGKASVKSITALGCCEVASLRRAFGKGGLIALESHDFTERLPYAIGLSHPDLRIAGFENGFCPLFKRGTAAGERLFLSSENYFLIFEGLQILEIYADYRDGGMALPLGLFDLTARPSADLTQAEHEECYDLIQNWCEQNAWQGDPPFGLVLDLMPDW